MQSSFFVFFLFQTLAKALEDNKTLKNLNIESNFISGEAILEIMKAINKNMTVIEFRITNQVNNVDKKIIDMGLYCIYLHYKLSVLLFIQHMFSSQVFQVLLKK